jgi:hypothetical protein
MFVRATLRSGLSKGRSSFPSESLSCGESWHKETRHPIKKPLDIVSQRVTVRNVVTQKRMPTLDEIIRVRIPKRLKQRLAKVADSKCKKLPEATREAVLAYVDAAEKGRQAA